ncbi:MAG: MoaD/ThiS family protein [Oligoflexales bacterium]|nr:MoaD/ThiS family protein [Oligoflexales bacterium]
MPQSITVKYFAALREQAGVREETIDTDCLTAKELFLELKAKYFFSVDLKSICVSINRQYADLDASMKSGDEIVFIPPVAGG